MYCILPKSDVASKSKYESKRKTAYFLPSIEKFGMFYHSKLSGIVTLTNVFLYLNNWYHINAIDIKHCLNWKYFGNISLYD